jgi:hypothetical protein
MLNIPDTETGKIVTGGLDILPRFNMAIALARHQKRPRKLIAALATARKSIQDGLDMKRNRAIHGLHFEEGGFTRVEMFRGKGADVITTASSAEYARIAEEIRDVRHQLQRGVGDAGYDWLPMPSAAVMRTTASGNVTPGT